MPYRKILAFTVLFTLAQAASAQDSWGDDEWESDWGTEQDQGIDVYGYV